MKEELSIIHSVESTPVYQECAYKVVAAIFIIVVAVCLFVCSCFIYL